MTMRAIKLTIWKKCRTKKMECLSMMSSKRGSWLKVVSISLTGIRSQHVAGKMFAMSLKQTLWTSIRSKISSLKKQKILSPKVWNTKIGRVLTSLDHTLRCTSMVERWRTLKQINEIKTEYWSKYSVTSPIIASKRDFSPLSLVISSYIRGL